MVLGPLEAPPFTNTCLCFLFSCFLKIRCTYLMGEPSQGPRNRGMLKGLGNRGGCGFSGLLKWPISRPVFQIKYGTAVATVFEHLTVCLTRVLCEVKYQ